MKRFTFLCFLLLVQGLLLAQGSRTEQRKLSSFNAIGSSGDFTIVLVPGREDKVHVESRQIALRDIQTEVKDNTLKISLNRNLSTNKVSDIRLIVTFKSLHTIRSAGNSDIFIQGTLKSDELNVKIAGAGDFRGHLDVNHFRLNVVGASSVKLSGKAGTQDINIAGAGDVKAFDLKGNVVNVSITGTGDAEVYATGELDANVSGTGDVRHKGQAAKISSRNLGVGSIQAMED